MTTVRVVVVFVFNDTATTEIYTLSLHDALPICGAEVRREVGHQLAGATGLGGVADQRAGVEPHEVPHAGEVGALRVEVVDLRSEEHTSELQSRQYLVCRLLLEKKN